MKNILKRILCGITTAAVMITSSAMILCVTASATKIFKTENDRAWHLEYWWQDFSTYSVDTKTTYGDSPYSIKIKNIDYNNTHIGRTFDVKPNTCYHFSAMVKYSGYKLSEDAYDASFSGAGIGVTAPWDMHCFSEFITENKWQRVSCDFITGKDQKTVGLSLYNSVESSECRGTAWFSDIKLEECEQINQWNVLAIAFTNISAPVKDDNGKQYTYKKTMSTSDVSNVKNWLGSFRSSVGGLSNGHIGIRNIDFVTCDTPVTELSSSSGGYRLDTKSGKGRDLIDKARNGKDYDYIIAILPLYDIKPWGDHDYTKYRQMSVCQFDYNTLKKFANKYKKFPEGMFMDAFVGSLKSASLAIDQKNGAVPSYSNTGYKIDPDYELKSWYADVLSGTLSGGKNLISSVLYVPSRDYVLVSDDMTPGENITVKGTLPTHISSLSVSKIKDKYYSGKEIKPSVTVKGAVKGTDYTATYKNCNAVGRGSVIIKGKGKYTGTVELTFNIKLKKTTAKKSGSVLNWAKVPGADGYVIYYSTGSKYKKLADIGASTSYDLTKLKSGSYTLAVRAYKETPYGGIYGDLSEGVNVKK